MASGPGQIIIRPANISGATDYPAATPLVPGPFPATPDSVTGQNVPANLLQIDRPTLVTVWAVESVYLPVFAVMGGNYAGSTMVITAFLKSNGTIVWSADTGVVPMQTPSVADTYGNAIISADLVNPIRIGRGDSLSLLLAASVTPNQTTDLVAGVGAQVDAGELGVVPVEGTIGYTVYDLPGRRSL